MEVTMLRGSCLCGGIRLRDQRKVVRAAQLSLFNVPQGQGAAFRSRARVRSGDFRWVAGERLLTFFESSPGNHRGFCRVCGSPILSKFDTDMSVLSLPLGALDDDPGHP